MNLNLNCKLYVSTVLVRKKYIYFIVSLYYYSIPMPFIRSWVILFNYFDYTVSSLIFKIQVALIQNSRYYSQTKLLSEIDSLILRVHRAIKYLNQIGVFYWLLFVNIKCNYSESYKRRDYRYFKIQLTQKVINKNSTSIFYLSSFVTTKHSVTRSELKQIFCKIMVKGYNY